VNLAIASDSGAADEPAGVFAPERRALTIGILLSITAVACEGMAVATVLPAVAQDLGGLDSYGWAFSAFMLSSLVGAISAGQVADRHDPSLPAYAGFGSFSAGLIVAGLAPSWPILLIGRALQGFGAGSLSAIAYVAVARGYPERLRPRLLALLSSAWILPALLGPALAGQVAEHASWRLVFIGIVPPMPIGALMLLPSVARLPTSTDTPYERLLAPDRAATASATAVAPVRGPRASWGLRLAADIVDSPRVRASLRLAAGVALVLLAAGLSLVPVALLLGAAGLVLAAPALRALLPAGTFSGRNGLPAAVAVRGLLAFGFFGGEALIPLGLSTQRGLPESLVGLALTAGALSWVLGTWVQDRAESRSAGSVTQRAIRVGAGLLLIAIGMVGVAVVILTPSTPVELVVVVWGVGGLGMGVAYPGSTLTALGTAPTGQEGAAAASLQVAETVGIAMGTGATGALFALAVHLQHAMAEGLAWGFLLAVLAILAAFAPAARLAPTVHGSARWWPRPSA
jgi:MFS family permease